MSRRRLGALVLAVAAAGGCGQDMAGAPNHAGATSADPATSELAMLDPCTLLSDAEIEALGFRPDTREPTDLLGLVGCGYFGPIYGDLRGLSVQKEPEDTVADYAARAETFGGYRANEVAGRAGAQVLVAEDGTDCTQMVNAGSGTVQVEWSIRESGAMDPCAEALRVMQMIEPELPAAGS